MIHALPPVIYGLCHNLQFNFGPSVEACGFALTCGMRAPPTCRFLTGALNDVAEKSGLSQAFLGLIILPIAGNACEHITAVFVAVKNKMDLAIGVALGSSIQVGLISLSACSLPKLQWCPRARKLQQLAAHCLP